MVTTVCALRAATVIMTFYGKGARQWPVVIAANGEGKFNIFDGRRLAGFQAVILSLFTKLIIKINGFNVIRHNRLMTIDYSGRVFKMSVQ